MFAVFVPPLIKGGLNPEILKKFQFKYELNSGIIFDGGFLKRIFIVTIKIIHAQFPQQTSIFLPDSRDFAN